MNTDELRAAAAKVLSAQSTVPLACVKLAKHVQRLYDETPVDEAWWNSIVNSPVVSFSNGVGFARFNDGWIEFETRDGLAILETTDRGQTLMMCEALGIKLREGE